MKHTAPSLVSDYNLNLLRVGLNDIYTCLDGRRLSKGVGDSVRKVGSRKIEGAVKLRAGKSTRE